MFLIPIVAMVANTLGLTIDKIVLARKRMSIGLYLSLVFLFIFFISALLTPFLGAVDHALVFQPKYLILFITMIFLAVTWNYLASVSIQKEKLHEHEMIIMLAPLATIILASIYSPTQVDIRVFIAAIVAGIFLIAAKIEKGHFQFNSYSVNLLIAVFLMAVEAIVINELLKVYSPVSLYAFRTGFVFLCYVIVFRPHFNLASRENVKLTVLSAVMGAAYMIFRFYGYKDFGIVKTTLFLIASPIILYMISAKYFKERVSWKTIFSSVIILGCIVYVSYIDSLSH
ncbi:MAG: EamA family transporter [bacterium]|nr:EamA family transporter [bacterium]